MPSLRVATVAAALALALAACAGPPAPREASHGGTLRAGTITDVDSWNEYLSAQSFATTLQRRLFLRLAREAPPGAPAPFEPSLAESWALEDGGRAIRFKLRAALWSDGRPVTSADVRFTWRAQTSSDVAWIGRENKTRIVDVEAPDPRTAVFRFDRTYPEQLADAVDGGILPEHVFGRVPFAQWRAHDWSRERVFSGPFALAEHRPGEAIVLRRNPRYFEPGVPRVDEVAFRIVPDAGNLVTQLLAGGLDWLDGVPPQDAARVAAAPGVRLLPYDVAGFDYVGWNGRKPPFDDPEVRRALTLALDRPAIVEEILYGFGRVAAGPVPAAWWCADRELRPWPFDPAEARRLLAAKGFGPGRPLTFEIATNAGNRQREAVLVKLQEQWARVGVVARPVLLEMKTLRERSVAGTLDAWLAGWRFSGKADLATIFSSAALPPAGSNVAWYRSEEADRWLAALTDAPDAAAAREAYAAVGRVLHRDQPYTFLYEPRRIAAAAARLTEASVDVPSDPLAGLERFALAPR